MDESLDKVLLTNKIKLLFDKKFIIQICDEPGVSERRRKIQDEAISIAYNIKEFDLIPQIAKKSYVRDKLKFYEVAIFLEKIIGGIHLQKNLKRISLT
jgi:hypothetical protein